jgi:hypothetical protein
LQQRSNSHRQPKAYGAAAAAAATSHPTFIFQQQALHCQCCQVSPWHLQALPPVRLLQRIINCQLHHMPACRGIHQVCTAAAAAARAEEDEIVRFD